MDTTQEIQTNMPIITDNVVLEKYFDTKIDGLKEYICARLDGIEKATSIAYSAMNLRLEGMNGFREELRCQNDQLRSQSSSFITRPEHDALIKKFDDDVLRIETSVGKLGNFQASIEGKASQSSVLIGYAVAATGILFGIIGIIIHFIP